MLLLLHPDFPLTILKTTAGLDMIIATLRMTASPGKQTEILHSLRPLLGPTRVQPGCLSCRLYRDVEHTNVFVWMEAWESQAALERHLRSAEYRILLALLDLSSQPPEIRFDTVAATQGMEMIAAVTATR
jgi:quinol monooxygenase YgiN